MKTKLAKAEATIDELATALEAMIRGYEADCACRNVLPENVVENHTWLALAYKEACAARDNFRS